MQDTSDSTKPLNKLELIALTLFSAMMFFLLAQVFIIAQKNVSIEQAEHHQITGQIDHKPETKSDTQQHDIKPGPEKPVAPALETTNSTSTVNTDHEVNIDANFKPANKTYLTAENNEAIDKYCETVGEKLGSVNVQDCKDAKLQLSGTVSNQNKPLTYRDFKTDDNKPQNEKTRIMLIGGIHGDEFSGVSISFKWLNKLSKAYADAKKPAINNYHWRVIPILNPDGLLQADGQSKRMNANDVDLNRNFPTEDWNEFAHKYWINKRGRDPRRFPGPSAGSEIETQWIVEQIAEFDPHAVISIHAPYGIVDSDGPIEPPKHLGPLQLKLLGTYPGSMGRYVGVQKNIPMLTVELKRAGTMPSNSDIDLIWEDILKWISNKVLNSEAVAAMQSIRNDDDKPVIDKKAGD